MNGPEFTEVEQPFIDQLVAMGWKHTTGSLDDPTRHRPRELPRGPAPRRPAGGPATASTSTPTASPGSTRAASPRPSTPSSASAPPSSLEANQAATELLLKGTDGRWRRGLGPGPRADRPLHRLGPPREQHASGRSTSSRSPVPPARRDKHIRPDLVLLRERHPAGGGGVQEPLRRRRRWRRPSTSSSATATGAGSWAWWT